MTGDLYHIYVPGKGNPQAKIMIVGEAPSWDEVRALTPFVGPSGELLNSMLRNAGIDRGECWITNVCKYMVPPNPKQGRKIPFQKRAEEVGHKLDREIENLRNEINQIKPNVIIPLGATALWAICGKNPIQSWRGSIIQGMGRKCVATYHPAHILHQEGDVKGYWNKQIMHLDLVRAKQQGEFPDFRLPKRALSVVRGAYELEQFIKQYPTQSIKRLSVDIEAHKCVPVCVGIAANSQHGLTVPLWNNEGISNLSNSELANCWSLLADYLVRASVVGQNFGYDRDKIKRLGFIIQRLADDTMYKSFCINPELPKNLAFNTSIYTEEPYYKDEGMYEGSMNDLLMGCARDACVTYEVNEKMDHDLDELGMRPYYENFLLPLHDLYSKIEQKGFRVDDQVQKDLLRKYVEWDEELRYKLSVLAEEPVNVASPKQISTLLYEKWRIPLRSGTGEEVLTQLLNGTIKNEVYKRGVEWILEDRRVRKTVSQYLLSLPDFDGRMRTSYFLCLETGRSSTNQQEPPIRPSLEYRDEKKVKKRQARGMAFQTITKHGDIGADVRKMLVPDEGKIFLQADSSQAEARVIFLLAEDYQALKDIDEHDYHALTASWFFGGTEFDYSKKVLGYESPIRFAGKTLRHAGHLGAGKRRACIELNTQARKNKIEIRITEKKAEEALKIFHRKQPNIKQVFHAGIIKCLERDRRLRAPVPYGIDAKVGGTRTFFERWGDELFRQAFSYIPQRTVSENTKSAALRIDGRAKWIEILVEAHDALLVQVDEERVQEAASILKEEFERPIDFTHCSLSRGKLVIPCDVESGYNYKDLSKFKWL